MGNRNPQGLIYSKKNNLLFSSEHQSKGGDEVNLIKIDR
jgi:glucose/arabinose dehydrogenase